MKSMIKTGVVAAVAAAFVASVAMADGQQPRRRGPGMGGPGGPGVGPGIMRELTDEQRNQVRAIMQEERGDREGRRGDMTLRRQLEAELLADVPNELKIEELKSQILAAQAEGLSKHIEIQKRVAQVLTPEQREKARQRLAQTPEGRRGEGRRGGRY